MRRRRGGRGREGEHLCVICGEPVKRSGAYKRNNGKLIPVHPGECNNTLAYTMRWRRATKVELQTRIEDMENKLQLLRQIRFE
ncbi:hypothetical protein HWQ67_19600 [Candidatus Magnetobacterium casensis]|uniref:Recombinase zinc beta ribbon domain-containing protein n=2 Tax=Candidatus Magnetobacterium casense TaxID=1455061 RepID=A0ABS6S4Y7_9BACT|nr:hypothetical protein [Candidatus Magnetobacterium casensis]